MQRDSRNCKLISEIYKAGYKEAKTTCPLRWSVKGRNWAHIEAVQLDPEQIIKVAEIAVQRKLTKWRQLP